ncbi:Gastrula zinc finger protein XlCGF57.1 [Channa argus]|uniref:Gastrula zinc finger protein XlCGF57.1 n=1 Tax=Channa argus TaxID=215402 RepID=A0A6G1PGL7_CHAAH|nr:Gastrula zinc finger protein XlCGF57.1 [Channa argus]
MSETIQVLRAFVSQRLTVAVEEIIGMFERTITEYEQEIDRHRRLLRAERPPGVSPNRHNHNGESQDTQSLIVSAKIAPEQKELSLSLHQEAPELLCIKEEPEEVWTSQEGQQCQGPEEANTSQFQLPPVGVKSEDKEENPLSLQLQQNQSEVKLEAEPQRSRTPPLRRAAGVNCGGSEAAFDLDVAAFLKATSDGQLFLSQCFQTETEALDDGWNQVIGPPPFSDPLTHSQAQKKRRSENKLYKCPACSKTFKHNKDLQRHISCHTGEKPFDCPECGKTFRQKGSLHIHMRKHTGEKPFSCLVCGKRFTQSGTLSAHMRIHTGEKPYSCSVCKKRYIERGTLVRHMRVHTGEKPFMCSLCGKRFSEKGNLNKHHRIHTGEKPFRCSDCEKRFSLLSHLKNHKCPARRSSEPVEQARQLKCPKVSVQLTRHTP